MQIPRIILPAGILGHVGAFYLHRILTLCFPLLLLPLLAHRLTPHAMGLFFVLQAWGLTLTYLMDYGLSAYGARSMASADKETAHSHEINRILTAQIMLGAVLLPLWLLAHYFIPVLKNTTIGAVAAFLMAASTAITPNWYFLGKQKLSGFIAIDLLSRCLALLSIWVLPYASDSFLMPYTLIVEAQMATCLFTILLVSFQEELAIHPINDSFILLKKNWRLCLAEIGLTASSNLNTILLSLFAPPALIAVYGVAEKIIRGCCALMVALAQALYPHFTRLQHKTALNLKQLFTWMIVSNGLLTLTATAGIWLVAPMILQYLVKDNPDLALSFTLWQIPALFLFGAQGTVYMHGLLARRQDGAALSAILFGAVIYIVVGIYAVLQQSIGWIIAAQTFNYLMMIVFAFYMLAQKKTPAHAAMHGGKD